VNRCALVCALASLASCGGEGVEAPYVIGADEDTGCVSADDAFANTRAALGIDGINEAGDELADLRPHLTRVLVDEGGLRVVVQGAAVLLQDPSEITLRRFLTGIDPNLGLGALTKHVVEVLRYIDGSSAHVDGAHPGPMAAVHEIVASCDAAETVTTLRALLELEVVDGADGTPALAPPGSTGGVNQRSWLRTVVEAGQAAVAEPALVEVIESIELDESQSGDGDIYVGRDAWAVLLRLVGANLAAPNFDPAATRALLDDVILVRITDAVALAKVDALLDVMLLVTEPDAAVFPQMQSIMGCIHDTDDEARLPDLLYDYLTIESLSYDDFLDDVGTAAGGDSATDLRLALIDLLRAFESEPAITRDVAQVAAKLLEPEPAALLVKAMLRLQGRGVVIELARITDALSECAP
jgi:hypothetical protein